MGNSRFKIEKTKRKRRKHGSLIGLSIMQSLLENTVKIFTLADH